MTTVELSKSRDDLIREAADRLQIVGTDQDLEEAYAERINVNVDPLLLQLTADGICNITNSNDIPGEWFDAIAGLLANICAGIAGKQFSPDIKVFYEMALRRVVAASPSYAIQETEYF